MSAAKRKPPCFWPNSRPEPMAMPPFFTSDQLPAYVAALIANYSTPEPPPRTRGPGRPRKAPKRVVDPHLRYAQADRRRVGGRVGEVKRHIRFGSEADISQWLATARGGAKTTTS